MDLLVILIALVILFILMRGLVKTFQKNIWLALIMLLISPPLYLCWVIVEGIFSKTNKENHDN